MNNITKAIVGVISIASLTIGTTSFASYGQRACQAAGMECYKVKRGESWSNLFPDQSERNIVMKVNRMNVPLRPGLIIAIPRNLESVHLMDVSPFPTHVGPSRTNHIRVDLNKLAWGAYDTSGELLRWGPASGGRDYCPDIKRACRTITGTFTVYGEKGADCRSSVYPRPHGGAPMPYCMHFFKGFALHGSASVPGYNASHGCVRLFTEDARWLNQEFVRPGYTRVTVTR